MDLKLTSLAALIILISGCVTTPPLKNSPVVEKQASTFADVYRRSKQSDKTVANDLRQLTLNEPTGFVKPYVPVILPPRVVKAWIPAHVLAGDKRVMVSGHWSFIMLEGTHWFIEGETN